MCIKAVARLLLLSVCIPVCLALYPLGGCLQADNDERRRTENDLVWSIPVSRGAVPFAVTAYILLQYVEGRSIMI